MAMGFFWYLKTSLASWMLQAGLKLVKPSNLQTFGSGFCHLTLLPPLGIHPNQEVLKFKPHGFRHVFYIVIQWGTSHARIGPLIDAVKQTHFCARKTNQTHGEFNEMTRPAAHFTWSRDHDVGHFGTYEMLGTNFLRSPKKVSNRKHGAQKACKHNETVSPQFVYLNLSSQIPVMPSGQAALMLVVNWWWGERFVWWNIHSFFFHSNSCRKRWIDVDFHGTLGCWHQTLRDCEFFPTGPIHFWHPGRRVLSVDNLLVLCLLILAFLGWYSLSLHCFTRDKYGRYRLFSSF